MEKTDKERLDWLEENLLTLTHARASDSLYMDGTRCFLRGLNDKRPVGGSYVSTRGRTIREAIDKGME